MTTRRPLLVLTLVALTACAHAAPPSSDAPSWDALYGTYEFSGTIMEDPMRSTPVSGTLRLGDDRYYLTTSHGTCDGLLAPTPSTDLQWGCRDGVSVAIRRIGDALDTSGTATITVIVIVDKEVCTTDADGNRVCTIRTQQREEPRRGRVVVRRLPGLESGQAD